MLTTRPSMRTLGNVASIQRYGYGPSNVRLRKRSTSASSSWHSRESWLLLIPVRPSERTSSSTRRVLTTCTTAASVCSVNQARKLLLHHVHSSHRADLGGAGKSVVTPLLAQLDLPLASVVCVVDELEARSRIRCKGTMRLFHIASRVDSPTLGETICSNADRFWDASTLEAG